MAYTMKQGVVRGVNPTFLSGLNCSPALPLRPLRPAGPRIGNTLINRRGLRVGELVVLREAVTAELVETKTAESASANGAEGSNGVYSNGSNGNGRASSNGVVPPPVVSSSAALAAALAAAANGQSSNGNGNGSSHGNGNGNNNGKNNGSNKDKETTATAKATASSNGANGSAAPATATATATASTSMSSLDLAMDPQAAGQIETVAATSAAAQNEAIARAAAAAKAAAEARATRSASGTPYKNPGGRWAKFKSYSTFQRTFEIWSFAIQFAFKYFLLNQKWTYGKEGMTAEAVSARKKELAIWLREGLVRLGPTFIKIGQQFSTRVDVLAPEFIKELEKLQDNVPPFDSETARQIVESNLGKPIEEVFSEWEEIPIAAASLGQVHLARVKATGERVVVKVQRPGLKELFDIDCKNIRALAVWLQKVDPKTDGAARDWVAIYDECSRILYQEIDYTIEGKNADTFRANFEGVDWVRVPKVLWEYTHPEVLVLEYLPGVKINDAASIDRLGLDRSRLARLIVECYLQQILRHGFFHADPHPGNVAVDTEGRLIYYDWGMAGSIPPTVKGGLLELFYGVYNRDPDRCLEALVMMGVYVPTGDRTAIRRTAEFFLKSFQERLDQQRAERAQRGAEYSQSFKPQRSKEEGKERRKQILSTIGEDLLLAANDQPFRFPATFTFVLRAFSTLEGIGKTLNPNYKFSEVAQPYAQELLDLQNSQTRQALLINQVQQQASELTAAAAAMPFRIARIDSLLEQLEGGDVKLRVRALEVERAARKMGVMQAATMNTIGAVGFLNVGTMLALNDLGGPATAALGLSALFGVLMLQGFKRIQRLEQFEKEIKGM
mmetsp:Transcript_29730/g.65790  ORF Transcript_29730/g.65790 Transcript_29730/m.65790 type:complete len:842 (-) Transcript_29730:440-2965(-)